MQVSLEAHDYHVKTAGNSESGEECGQSGLHLAVVVPWGPRTKLPRAGLPETCLVLSVRDQGVEG